MFNPRAFVKFAAFGLASLLFGGNALMAQISVGPDDVQGGGSTLGGKGGKSSKVHDDDAAGRLDWWRQRMGGDLTPEFMARVMREAEKQRLLHPERFNADLIAPSMLPEGVPLPLAVSGTSWTNIGPTKSNKIQNGSFTRTDVNSGRLRTILPDSADPETMYLLTSGGGLWKTTNFRAVVPLWTALTDNVGSTSGGAAAFGRVTTGSGTVLYLGLGDAFDVGVGGFMVKSTNAGTSWSAPIQLTSASPALTATRILDVKVDTTGVMDVVLVGTDVGLFRSTDSGATYTLVNDVTNLNGKYVWSMALTGLNTWVASAENIGGGRTGVLLRSTNGGASWAAVATPLAGVGRMTLAVGAPGESNVYCFAANNGDTTQKDLYYSTNGGNNWTACAMTAKTPTNQNGDNTNMNLMHGQAFYNHMILVDPTDPTRQTVYLGGNLSTGWTTNARAASSGSTWTLLTNWLPGGNTSTINLPYAHADFHCAAFSNVDGTERLLFGNDGGLAVGTNRAGGWNSWDHTKNVGIITHLIYALVTGPQNGCNSDSVLAGLQDNGVHNRIGATSVFDQTNGGDGFGVGWSQATNAASLSSYVYNDIVRCTSNPPDDISKWNNFVGGWTATGGADNGASFYFVTPIITAPSAADATGNVFYTYSNTGTGPDSKQIFRTTGGGNWTPLGTLPTPAALGTKLGVRAVSHGVGAHPTDPARLAAACISGYVITTTNTGGTWTPVLLGTTGSNGQNIGWYASNANVEWVDNNNLFICSEATTPGAAHVARSTNGGTTWTRQDTGLLDLPVTKIVCDRGDATGNTLYAATWLGVYRTTNALTSCTWSLFGTGLPQVRVSDIYVHPSSAFIRVSAWGRGIWQLGTSSPTAAPVITLHPVGAYFTPPTTFSLTVAATGTGLTYQWRRNGVNLANGGAEGITGATSTTLKITTSSCSASAGEYDVVITNCAGSATSYTAGMISTVGAPVITSQPANTRSYNNANYALKVVATGATSYQWRLGGVNLTNTGIHTNVTSPTLSISGDTRANGTYLYDCVVGNGASCSTTSNTAIVGRGNGNSQPPNVVKNPSDLVVTAPTNATFAFTSGGGRAGGNTTLTFQWRKGGQNLTNGGGSRTSWTPASVVVNVNSNITQADATSTLTIANTVLSDADTYDCVVSSSSTVATVTSRAATLGVRLYSPATAVSITPSQSLPAPHGTPVVFTAVGSGSLDGLGNPTPASVYQYQFWVYWNSALGWTMVQDYGVGSTYTLPGTTPAGAYGIGVDCRTSPAVLWDTFNSIDFFNLTSFGGPELSKIFNTHQPDDRPTFAQFHTVKKD